jgi:hypothetical protein
MDAAANYEERYAAMSDGELAEIVSGDLGSLNEEARSAFQAELRKRGLTLAKLREQYPPEPAENDDQRESRGSLLQEFGFLGVPVGLFTALALFFVLAGNHFATQVAILFAYSVYVFFFLFSNLRSSKGYDLSQEAVRQTIPHLLAIHAAFLALVFVGLTVALWLRPALPPAWTVERGRRGGSWFDVSLLLIGFATCMFQIHICRKILSRSVAANHAKLTSLNS